MHPHDFIRKNIISTLLAEGVPAEDAQGGLPLHWITTAAALRQAVKAACSTICFMRPASGCGSVRAAVDAVKLHVRVRGVFYEHI